VTAVVVDVAVVTAVIVVTVRVVTGDVTKAKRAVLQVASSLASVAASDVVAVVVVMRVRRLLHRMREPDGCELSGHTMEGKFGIIRAIICTCALIARTKNMEAMFY